MTENWWESVDAFMAAAGAADGVKAAQAFVEDEADFVNFSRLIAFFTREHLVYARAER